MIVDLQYLAQNLNDSALTYNILDATASLQLAAARMDAMVAEVPPWREQQPWWHGAQPDEDMSLVNSGVVDEEIPPEGLTNLYTIANHGPDALLRTPSEDSWPT